MGRTPQIASVLLLLLGVGSLLGGIALIASSSFLVGISLTLIGIILLAILLRFGMMFGQQQLAQQMGQQQAPQAQQAAPQQAVTPIVVAYPPMAAASPQGSYGRRMRCPSCTAEVNVDDPYYQFCPRCGARWSQVVTP